MPAALKVIAYALDGLVEFALNLPCLWRERRAGQVSANAFLARTFRSDKTINPAQESLNAFDARILPVEIAVRWSGEQAVEARGVGAIASHHFVRTDDVAETLRHFGAIFNHHALREEAFDGFVMGDEAEVAHELGPEARVDEVKDSVLNAADVLVDGKPILRDFGIERSAVVVRVRVTIEIPGRIDEGVHGIGFAPRQTAALGTRRVDELGQTAERRSRACAISMFSGKITGKSFSGTGTMPSFSQ